ncbi:hypothetical protein ACFPOI_33770 [Nonomuraea angiospora]|uniref:ABC transporter ATP-binding protein n=1 Tax=Nonomuraea angiospora TaxID=46172 RepID=A0ABR9LU34_9ACTN|nr:hypothetical protein [Nonomuraea angiospora]MBE1583810.1 hypothetical protein [Nonomuraea angiospora]
MRRLPRADRTRTIVLVLAGLLTALAAVAAVPGEGASGAGQRLTLAVTALSVSRLLGTAVGRQIAAAREAVADAVRLLPHEAALGLLGLPADPATDLTRAGGLPALIAWACLSVAAG